EHANRVHGAAIEFGPFEWLVSHAGVLPTVVALPPRGFVGGCASVRWSSSTYEYPSGASLLVPRGVMCTASRTVRTLSRRVVRHATPYVFGPGSVGPEVGA